MPRIFETVIQPPPGSGRTPVRVRIDLNQHSCRGVVFAAAMEAGWDDFSATLLAQWLCLRAEWGM